MAAGQKDALRYMLLVTGLDDQIEIVDKIAEKPTFKVIAKLEAALRGGFLNTQARTHVLTGHLKASGRTESDFDGEVWSGSIEYGIPGDANWAKDPRVSYAIFEMARGGEHDFFAELPLLHPRYVDALASHFGE